MPAQQRLFLTFWLGSWFVVWHPFVSDIPSLPEGWDRFSGMLAQVGMLASGVAAWWGWRSGNVPASAPRGTLEGPWVPPATSSDPVARLVRGPALGLILVGAIDYLEFVACVYGLASLLMWRQVPLGFLTLTEDQAKPIIALSLSGATAGGVILLAGLKLLDRSSFGLAWAASVLAMIPFTPGCILGLPLGLWTFSVLTKPEVVAAGPERRQPSDASEVVKPPASGVGASALAGDFERTDEG